MEINLAFGPAGLHEKPVNGVRFKAPRLGVCDPGAHPRNALAIKEPFDGRDVGVGDQMPEWRRKFVGCVLGERNHFDRAQLIFSVEQEGNRINLRHRTSGLDRPGLGNYLNMRVINPVGEIINVNASQQDGQDDQHVLF